MTGYLMAKSDNTAESNGICGTTQQHTTAALCGLKIILHIYWLSGERWSNNYILPIFHSHRMFHIPRFLNIAYLIFGDLPVLLDFLEFIYDLYCFEKLIF